MNLQHKKSMVRRLRGQGMSEYLVIVGMIAVAGIVVSGTLGDVVKGGIASAAGSLSGDTAISTTATATIGAAAADLGTQAAVDAKLGQDLSAYGAE